MTADDRIKAITAVAALTGRTRAEVLRLTPSVTAEDADYLRAVIARTPEPPRTKDPATALEALDPAAMAIVGTVATADASALKAWRDFSALKKSNPIAAAALMNSKAFEINRGRALDTTPDDSGPQAA